MVELAVAAAVELLLAGAADVDRDERLAANGAHLRLHAEAG